MKKPKELIESKWFENEPLKKWTSLGIGGKAEVLCLIENVFELDFLIKYCEKYSINYFFLGGGTNLLFSDNGFKGIIIKLAGMFNSIEESEDKIIAGSGLLLNRIVKYYSDKRYSGASCLYGIPGTVGGAVYMNAGTRWGNISDIIMRLNIYKKGWINIKKENFKYRKGIEKIILFVEMKKNKTTKDKIKLITDEIIDYRRNNFPKSIRTAGSIFKNPKDNFAGKLIEGIRYKGKKFNNIYISKEHSNIFVTEDNAKAQDVIFVIRKVKEEVYNKFSINLELELKIVDENGKYIKI